MTSKARSQKRFLYPISSQEAPSTKDEGQKKRRRATVYDATAGRISSTGFIQNQVAIPSTRDTTSTSTMAVAPETVLSGRRNTPTRYTESDIHVTNETESPRDLPGSELLKAIHGYASDFYSRATPNAGASDWQSLDGTALIALAILLEEASRESLGETGDMVFVEGEEDIAPDAPNPIIVDVDSHTQVKFSEIENGRRVTKGAKRRRVVETAED
ncbi:membrane protein [Phlyctema vagabunda]|uniref:Membrane protein n=1 Tax=Phlyctema vagabunda TaxID=108571 RepID=A0ABR4PL08_9HELO